MARVPKWNQISKDTSSFIDTIEKMRIEKGMSMSQLAKSIGLNPSSLSPILKKKSVLTLENALAISKVLDIPLDNLLRIAY